MHTVIQYFAIILLFLFSGFNFFKTKKHQKDLRYNGISKFDMTYGNLTRFIEFKNGKKLNLTDGIKSRTIECVFRETRR